MTTETTERDLVTEVEEMSGWAILALPPSPHWKEKATFDGAKRIDELLRRLVEEVKHLREQVASKPRPKAGDCIGRFAFRSDECTKCGLSRKDHSLLRDPVKVDVSKPSAPPPLIVSRDGVPCADQAAALEEFKERCRASRDDKVSGCVHGVPICDDCQRSAATSGAREAAEEILDYLNFDCSLDAVKEDISAATYIIEKHFGFPSAVPVEEQDYVYAVRLATALRDRFYADSQDWQPLETLNGVLSQIDNMIAGLPPKSKPMQAFKIEEPRGPF